MRVAFLFDVGSPNAYLAHKAIPQIEQRGGIGFALGDEPGFRFNTLTLMRDAVAVQTDGEPLGPYVEAAFHSTRETPSPASGRRGTHISCLRHHAAF